MAGWGSSLWNSSLWGNNTDLPSNYNIYFNCIKEDIDIGVDRPGVITVSMSIDFDRLEYQSWVSTFGLSITISATVVSPYVNTTSEFSLSLSVDADIYNTLGGALSDNPWVWTAKIGEADFDLDDAGEATRRPMSYNGGIYKIRKLKGGVMVYAENGITRMIPYGVNWEVIDLLKIGLMGRNAMCGTQHKHIFITNKGDLGIATPDNPMSLIDYSNILSSLNTNVVMSYNAELDIAYIADGTLGYAFSKSGLGQCPVTLTGVGNRYGAFYVVSPTTITNSPLEVTTDIIDFESRFEKTIDEVEVGLYAANAIYVAIDYRWSKSDSFSTTAWTLVNNFGIAHFCISGIEFRIKVKLLTYESIELHYITINGSFIRSRYKGGQN